MNAAEREAARAHDELVLQRFRPTAIYEQTTEPQLLGMYVDVETTGLDPERDEIIALAVEPFMFTADGRVISIIEPLVWYEEPSNPITPEITRINGLTDDMVRGKKIADGEVSNLVVNAAIVIAHNAEFDRQFCERRLSLFKRLRWGCSKTDVPWQDEGYTSDKLEWLLFKHCGMFFDAHDAQRDCEVGVHLLSTKLPSGARALSCVLDAARKTWVRLYAASSPYEARHVLKARGYKWSDGNDGLPKAWHIDVPTGEEYVAEIKWLAADGMCSSPVAFRFDARSRFSNRVGR